MISAERGGAVKQTSGDRRDGSRVRPAISSHPQEIFYQPLSPAGKIMNREKRNLQNGTARSRVWVLCILAVSVS